MEWCGRYSTENALSGRRGLFGAFPQLGGPLGFILANGIFLAMAALLPSDEPRRPSIVFLDWGWRLPFLLAGLFAVIGIWVRLTLVESEAFRRAEATGRIRSFPVASLFRECGGAVFLGVVYTLATTVLFFSMSTFSLSYGRAAPDAPLPGLGYDYTSFLGLQMFGVMFCACTTVISGRLIDRFGRRPMMLAVTAAIAIFGLLWVPLLSAGTGGLLAWLILNFTLMGLTFGPIGALLPELFPSHLRYTGSGMAYNISLMLGASPAPFIVIALWHAGAGSPVLVGVYLPGVAMVTLVGLLAGKDTKHTDILR